MVVAQVTRIQRPAPTPTPTPGTTPTPTPTPTPRGSGGSSGSGGHLGAGQPSQGHGDVKQGSMLYYDNMRSQWHKVFAALHSDGTLALHATGCRGSHHFRPLVHLAEVTTLYRTPSSSTPVKELPQLYGVVFALELRDGELMLLRTTEPKGAADWILALEAAVSAQQTANAAAKMKTLDELRAHRASLSPHLYSHLFRDRQDPTSKLAIRGVPPVPAVSAVAHNGVIRQRRTSLSAQTPSRLLPVRRPPLIPVVSAHFRSRPNDAVQGAPPLVATGGGGDAMAATASARSIVDGGAHPPQPPATCEAPTTEVSHVVPTTGNASPKGKVPLADRTSAANARGTASPNGKLDAAKCLDSDFMDERPADGTPGSEVLKTVSPNRALRRLNSLMRQEDIVEKDRHRPEAEEDAVCAEDRKQRDLAAVVNLKAQIERLTRRNIDLQISELNSQTRVLELEQALHDTEAECHRLGSRCMALQNALDTKDAEAAARVEEEKQDLMQSIQAEVEAQWQRIKQEWAMKEAEYKQIIDSLTGQTPADAAQ